MSTIISDNVWLGWTPRESGSKGFRDVNGDHGHAQGKYQFDYRYALVGFLKYCANFNKDRYGGFVKFANYGAGSSKLVNNSDLANLWTSVCNKYPEEFESLQDAYAYINYYLPVKQELKKLCGIDLDNHHPVVRGSAFSMSIRSGSYSAAKKFSSAGCTDKMDDISILKKSYATYKTEDASRWTSAKQLGDALTALSENRYSNIITDGITAKTTLVNEAVVISSSVEVTTEAEYQYVVSAGIECDSIASCATIDDAVKAASTGGKISLYVYGPNGEIVRTCEVGSQMYRVGTDWKNGKCVSQEGAYTLLSNAIAAVSKAQSAKKKPYYVFNSHGNKISTCRDDIFYRVGTGWKNGKCSGQQGAYGVLENAIDDAIVFAKTKNSKYDVFTNSGEKIYSAIPK